MNAGKNRFRKNITKRWPICCLLFFFVGCNNKGPVYEPFVISVKDSIARSRVITRAIYQVNSIQALIRSGDLVTRTGNDFASESLRQLNQRDQTYSHCGIASIEHDSVFIYHALGGEFNPDQKVRRDPLALFGEPYSNTGIGIFRFDLTTSEKDLVVHTIKGYHQAGLMFDMKFDLESDNRMYCTELVYKTFSQATAGRLRFSTSFIGQFKFIGVDDLYLQSSCIPVKMILYN